MLSLVGPIYRDVRVYDFIKGVVDQAKKPYDIEFVIIHDEYDLNENVSKKLEEAKSFSNLKVVNISKLERVSHIEYLLNFYDKFNIFNKLEIEEFRSSLNKYSSNIKSNLWMPAAWMVNKGIKESTGDVIFNLNAVDSIVKFDVIDCYERFRDNYGCNCIFFGAENHNRLKHHGARMFNRTLADKMMEVDINYSPEPYLFDERWFLRAFHEDYWNGRCHSVSTTWHKAFKEDKFIFITGSLFAPDYLCSNYFSRHQDLLSNVREYLLKYKFPKIVI